MYKVAPNTKIFNIFILIYIFLITIVIYYYNSKNINLKIAYQGWGPQDYVSQKLSPENYKKNWDSGILAYDNSIIMKAFYVSEKYFGISTNYVVYPFIFIQTFLFILSVFALTQTLFKNPYVSILAVSIVSVSNLAGLNLSRFGHGFSTYLSLPLFYAFANSFRLFAINYFLKKQYYIFSFFIIIAFYTHFTMAFFAFVFILSYSFLRTNNFYDRDLNFSILIVILSILPYIYYIFTNTSASVVPTSDWIKSTKIFCLHWYPITMKLFTDYAHLEFYPILLISALFVLSFKALNFINERHRTVIYGCIVCVFITVIGVFVSDIVTIPFLAKISLQRSTALLTFFGVLYSVKFLHSMIIDGNILFFIVAIHTLFIMAFVDPGIAILPILIFLIIYFKSILSKNYKFKFIKFKKYNLLIIFTSVTVIFTLIIVFAFIKPSAFLDVSGDFSSEAYSNLLNSKMSQFYFVGGSLKIHNKNILISYFLLLATSFFIYRYLYYKEKKLTKILILMIVCSAIVFQIKKSEYFKWNKRYYEISKSYFTAQLWAKNSTPKDSLFQVDPTHYYGWRDFSKRSSLGNLREWGFTSIAYDPNIDSYNDGIELLQEHCVFIPNIKQTDLKENSSFRIMRSFDRIAQDHYYSISNLKRASFLTKYRVDYFVMQKQKMTEKDKNQINIKFPIAYENEHYIVFQSYNL